VLVTAKLLDVFFGRIPMAVVPSRSRFGLDLFLSRLGRGHYFAATVAGQHVANGKPDPEPCLAAAPRNGVRRAACVAFQDSAPAPAVLDDGEVEGRYYFDMEFIRGEDAVTFLRHASYSGVRSFADTICAYLAEAAANDPVGAPPGTPSLFEASYKKVCDVQRQT